MCKAHNFQLGYGVMRSTAHSRDACVLGGTKGRVALVWQRTSEFVRRGRCGECGTALLYDNEWFEPNTLWLQNAKVVTATGEVQHATDVFPRRLRQFLFADELVKDPAFKASNPDGNYDADVRWDCMHVVPAAVPWDPAGEIPEDTIKAVIANDAGPEGRAHFAWPGYYALVSPAISQRCTRPNIGFVHGNSKEPRVLGGGWVAGFTPCVAVVPRNVLSVTLQVDGTSRALSRIPSVEPWLSGLSELSSLRG
eukprot:127056-Prymnesium_polylepis.2